MQPNGDSEKIKDLESKLYARNAPQSYVREDTLKPREFETASSWEEINKEEMSKKLKESDKPKRTAPIVPILIFSILFFLGAAGYAGYSIFYETRTVSPDRININISGPISAPGGEALSLDVSIQNENKAMLETASLIVEYPAGTRSAENPEKELPREKFEIGTIKPGEIIREKISAILYGEAQTKTGIKATLEYRIPQSNSLYTKDVSYDLTLSSNPVSVTVDSSTELTSGQDMSFNVRVHSNASETLRGVLVKVNYPAGFTYVGSNTNPLAGNSLWALGDIPAGEERKFTFHGTLSGEQDDVRVFRFESGAVSSKNPKEIGTTYSTVSREVAVAKPFIGLGLSVNGSQEKELSVQSGGQLRVELSYVNNLPVPVSNGVITLSLVGAYDRNSVRPENNGFFDSSRGEIRWDRSLFSPLGILDAGAEGILGVTFSSKNTTTDSSAARNPEIRIEAGVSGERVEENNVPQVVSSAAKRTIKISSNATLASRLFYSAGGLSNIGPIPPQAEKKTSYTVTWTVANPTNDVAGATVEAGLPSYVTFVDRHTPSSESVVYDKARGVVRWDLGSVKAGTGFGAQSRQVSFTIEFTPSLSQIGSEAVLLKDAVFKGQDRFTGSDISSTAVPLTTNSLSDGGGRNDVGTVVQ